MTNFERKREYIISYSIDIQVERESVEFDLCSSGRLLIISLGEPKGTELTRDLCRRINVLAEEIAKL